MGKQQLSLIDSQLLLAWYEKNQRTLPWRNPHGLAQPYLVWISEVMLQQTTVAAVIPFFEKFTKRFPDIDSLAKAPLEEVLPYWAGLGYYSRVRNLHKAAKLVAAEGMPTHSQDLIKLPGVGPYTANAIASIAFGETIGVLDGNVIRVLSRRLGIRSDWWNPAERAVLQGHSNTLAQMGAPEKINQALMELGATICTPQKYQCGLCPWVKRCEALKQKQIDQIPTQRPRKKFEIWHWRVEKQTNTNELVLVRNHHGPVLKDSWVFPGEFEQLNTKPQKFELTHTITHHKIYISFINSKTPKNTQHKNLSEAKRVSIGELSQVNPSIVLKKIVDKMNSSRRPK